jgi:hypothetical protein
MWSKATLGVSCFAEEKIHQLSDDSEKDLKYYEGRAKAQYWPACGEFGKDWPSDKASESPDAGSTRRVVGSC